MWFYVGSSTETLPTASLDLQFGSVMPTGMSLDRSGTAMGRDASGQWVEFAVNTPRTWFDPATLDGPFLMVEPSRTQVLYRTRQPTPYSTQATIGYDAAIETPFGAGSATVIPNTVSGTHGWAGYLGNAAHGAAIADNTTLAIQAVMKPIGVYKEVAFFILNRTNTYSTCRFSLDGAGTVVSQSGVVSAEIVPDANGFYTIRVVNNFGTGTTVPAITANIYNETGTRTYAGNGTSGMHLAYLGAEIGTEATSPIINTGVTTVTRAADIVTSTVDWVTAGGKSIGIDYVPIARAQQAILHFTGTDSLTLTNSLQSVTYNGTAGANTSISIAATDPKPGKRRTVVLTGANGNYLLVQDGVLLGSDNDGSVPSSFSGLRVGAQSNGALAGPMLVRRIKYWNQALTLESAKTYSADLSKAGDDLSLPVFEIQSEITLPPETNSFDLLVVLTGGTDGASVGFKTVNGTALAGVDYVGTNGTLSIDPGQTSATIPITLNTRGTVEDKSFTIQLSAPNRATIASGTCVVHLPRVIPAGVPSSTQINFGSTLPTGVVHTRSSIAWTRNSAGNWTQVAVDGYRQHFTAPGISGMLIEPAAAEQRLYDSVNPGWTATNGTITTITNEQTPTGLRYIRFRETAVTGEHKVAVTLTSANCDMPTGEFTTSIMIRPIFRPYIRMTIKGIDNVVKIAHLDLNDPPAISGDSGLILTIEKDPFYGASGWHRISLDRPQVTSAGVSAEIAVAVEDAAQAISFGGVTSDGFDLCHIQLENGAGMSSPIIVQGASAKTTRAADVLKASGTWWQLNTYSLAMRFIRLRGVPNTQRLWIAKDTTNIVTNDDNGITTVGGLITANLRTGGVSHAVITGPSAPIGTASTVLMTVNPNAKIAVYSGGAKMGEQIVGITGAPSPVAVAALRFGATEPSGLQPGSIVIQAIYGWTSPLSEADSLLVSGNLNYSPPSGAQPLPIVSVPQSITVMEGSTLTVPITKTGSGACSVAFNTKAVTATFATDYTGVGPVTVSFAANDTVKTVDVVTATDAVEDPGETFSLNLASPSGCELGTATGLATILEKPRLSVPQTASVTEGGIVNVIITKLGAGACSVQWRTQQSTATLTSDYTGMGPITLNFTENETSRTVSVQTATDALVEPTETFSVIIENPVGCTITSGTCTVSILDPSGSGEPNQTAFPAATGFASTADCGTGYPIYRVTNLNDSGTGSLRSGVQAGNCMIVFEVGGRIQLLSTLTFGSNVTIAGETAPPPGITIQKKEFEIKASNIRISHITFERGYENSNAYRYNGDVGKVGPGGPLTSGSPTIHRNIHFSHCAFYWSIDETVEHWPSASRRLENISYHDCIFTEALHKPSLYDPNLLDHEKVQEGQSNHTYGMIIGYGVTNIDLQYCLFSEMSWRCPRIDHSNTVVVANVISNNCGNGASLQQSANVKTINVTIKGYLCISGPQSGSGPRSGLRWNSYPQVQAANSRVYASNLYGWRGGGSTYTPGTTPTYDQWWVDGQPPVETFEGVLGKPFWLNGSTKVGVMVNSPPIDTNPATVALSAQEIYDRALVNIGPRPKDRRSSTLQSNPGPKRTVDRLSRKTGAWVNHENEVGGFYAPLQVNRALNGNTTFPDGSAIPAPPAQPQPATTTSKAAMKTWLRKFLDQVQYD
jgi:hypothetical protein